MPTQKGRKTFYPDHLKDEMGRMAASNGTEAATEHYSIRLGFPVREAAVRRFKEAWMTKNNVVAREVEDGGLNDGRFYYEHQQQHHQDGGQQQQQHHLEGGGAMQYYNPQPLSLTISQEESTSNARETGGKKDTRKEACKVDEDNQDNTDDRDEAGPSHSIKKSPKKGMHKKALLINAIEGP